MVANPGLGMKGSLEATLRVMDAVHAAAGEMLEEWKASSNVSSWWERDGELLETAHWWI